MRLDIEGGWYYVVNQGTEIRVISEVVPEEHFIELSAHIHSVEAWAIPGLMNWNSLEPLASETRKALLVTATFAY